MNPESAGAGYGYAGMGPYEGGYLRDLIVNGRAKPSKIISHHIRIDQAPEAYSKFDQRVDGYTEVVIRFDEKIAA